MARYRYVSKIRADEASLWLKGRPLLTHLDMEVTERCNNNCIHCYINLPDDDLTAKRREISTEEVKRVLEEAASLGCLTLKLTGGEPLLREDFEELYLFARRLGLKVTLFTNATLISTHLAELFTNIPPLEKIEVTVYGMKKTSYEAITKVSGSFEAAWRGLSLLREYGVPFVVKSVFLPFNKNELEDFEAWSGTLSWMDRPPSYSTFLDLRGRRDNSKKNEIIKRLRISSEESNELFLKRPKEYFNTMKTFCSKFLACPGDNLFSCGAGIGSGCVDAYGYLQLCMMLRHPSTIYDLKNGSLRDALTTFFPRIRALKAEDPEYLRRCARCFLKGLCEQCPAKSWMEHGTLDSPANYFCQIAHTEARILGIIKKDEMAWEVENWKGRIEMFLEKDMPSQKQEALDNERGDKLEFADLGVSKPGISAMCK